MRVIAGALLGLSIAMADPAHAGFNDGNRALSRCTSTQDHDISYCLGLIAGLTDGVLDSTTNVICLPQNVTIGQLRDVLLRHLANNPESRHVGAGAIMFVSLITAFPCRR